MPLLDAGVRLVDERSGADSRYIKRGETGMKKVIIIGGGIAGLTAGIYARQSGFDTTIFEMHSIPGGFCTSWRRKGYLFEGGMHWLTGSGKDQPLYRGWKEVGALDETTSVLYRDPFLTFDHMGETVYLYRDLGKLEAHFGEVSPEDRAAIRRLCKDVKAFQKMKMPVMDIKGVKVKQKSPMNMGDMLGMLPLLPKMSKLGNMTAQEYTAQFKSPALRAILNDITGADSNCVGMIATLATLTSGDGGYPKGGSLAMALDMAKRFEALGGKTVYNVRVEKVIMEDGRAQGVAVGGETVPADAVIVTQDTLAAIDMLFDRPLDEPWMREMRKNTLPMLNVFIGMGVEADLSALPGSLMFSLEKPVTVGSVAIESLGVYNYAAYEGYAPQGCSALTAVIMGDSYDFWKKRKEDGSYEEEKQKAGDTVVALLSKKWPQIAGKVAVTDVATPVTYERYCGSFKGSWMSVMRKGQKMLTYPIANESLKNLYFAGQRMMPPGGLPTAFDTGRKAVQYLCRDTDTVFQGQA